MKNQLVAFLHICYTLCSNGLENDKNSSSQFNYVDVRQLLKKTFTGYPDYRSNFITYGDKDIDYSRNNVYEGMVKIMYRNGGFDILLTDGKALKIDGNTFLSEVERNTELFRCDKSVQFCSGNPRYCEFQQGDDGTQIILTVTHGGGLNPKTMPDRGSGYFVNDTCVYDHEYGKQNKLKPDTEHCAVPTLKDDYTNLLAIRVADEIKRISGKRPHVVLMNLRRSKVDVNREIEMGTFGNLESQQAYKDFHLFITYAKSLIKNRGILFDIHGQGHLHNLVELGYDISRPHINANKLKADQSSINALSKFVKIPFEVLFRGNASLGYFLEREGVGTLPSPVEEHQKPGQRVYFDGHHITGFYGSHRKGTVDALQVEVPKVHRQTRTYKVFATKLAYAISNFMALNYVHRGLDNHQNWPLSSEKEYE